jgi:DNA-directed RNA polymerase subunit beta'
MPRFLSPEFTSNLPEITTSKILTSKKKFHSEGLFSEHIFGSLKNYTCQCGTYYGASGAGTKCKICGLEVTHSRERRSRFAKIVLPFEVVNPIFYDLYVTIAGNAMKKHIDTLMKSDKHVVYFDKKTKDLGTEMWVALENDEKYPPDAFLKYERTEAIYEVVKWSTIGGKGMEGWDLIAKHIDKLLIKEIVVLPPDIRPAPQKITEKELRYKADKINWYYNQLLTRKETIRDTILDIMFKRNLYYTYFKQIQRDVDEIYEYVIGKLSKKEGLIRGNILGKRIDFSGRAVIAPDPTLKIDECKLPYLMVLELLKLQISKKLIDHGKFKFLNDAIDYVDKCIYGSDPALADICREIIKDEVCLLNRQPSLHRLGLLGFKVKMTMSSVIKIHPLICAGYNADFDGDQMAVYLPISDETKEEVREKFLSTKNLWNPSNATLTTTPSQDIVLGIYILTSDMIPKLSGKVMCKNEMISEGMKLFNDCFPEDYRLINTIVRKKELLKILNEVNEKYSSEVTSRCLDMVKDVGLIFSTLYGTTLSINGLSIEGIEDIKNSIYNKTDLREQVEAISSKEIEDILRKNFRYSYLIDSGARGSWEQARQIVLTRGFVSNFNGKILETPVKNNLIQGLSQEEFFLSTYGCRKGLLDVAVNTGDSGYLSRKLMFTCVNLQKHESLDDCGTKDTLGVYVDNEQKARMLIYRYFVDENGQEKFITKDNYLEIVGKHIQLRSPIFCKSEEICNKCYGDLWKIVNSRFIGTVAAQALGEVGTQLVLRVFHTSGVAQLKGGQKEESDQTDDLKQMDIIGDLSTASKLLHSNKNVNCEEIVNNLYKVYNESKDIHHVHFEAVISQLMWIKARKWRLSANRDKIKPQFFSIQTVPEKESWLLGLGFSNPKKNILRGILHSGHYKGIMDRILLGEVL